MKHVIKSDTLGGFNILWTSFMEKLDAFGEEVVKSKIKMIMYNNDYSGYKPHYVAKVWTKRKEETK